MTSPGRNTEAVTKSLGVDLDDPPPRDCTSPTPSVTYNV
jgi:hypothetical protein